jgi:hypothetical protein
MKHENGDGTMIFKITEEMLQKIQDWDSCKPVDVSGAKFAYTFVPTGLGLVIKVQCDICKRVLNLTEDW